MLCLSVRGTGSCRYLSHIAQIPHTEYVVVCSIVCLSRYLGSMISMRGLSIGDL